MPSHVRSHRKLLSAFTVRIIFAICIYTAWSTDAQATVVVSEYTFECPVVKPVNIDGQTYDRVFLPEAPNSGAIGYHRCGECGGHRGEQASGGQWIPDRTDRCTNPTLSTSP